MTSRAGRHLCAGHSTDLVLAHSLLTSLALGRLSPRQRSSTMTKITTFFAPKPQKHVVTNTDNHTAALDSFNRVKATLLLVADDAAISSKRVKKQAEQVRELIASLENAKDWISVLRNHFDSASFEHLAQFVIRERLAHTIYPAPADTFAALTLTPLERVRVVIVGQDPYHGPRQAHGLCFSVLPGHPVPPSLKNVYHELRNDPDVDFSERQPSHGHLVRWAQQGILLLNTVLTVQRGEANSHQKKGWESVTDEILKAVDRHHQKKGVVFLLWGRPAAAKAQAIVSSSTSKHTIICTSHPSPLGARKTNKPFLGSRCFSRCNQALLEKGYNAIDWNVDASNTGRPSMP
jgi:uracil-DNA glycosylase